MHNFWFSAWHSRLTFSFRRGSLLAVRCSHAHLIYVNQYNLFMASNFYDYHLPDYCDLDNKTGQCPGFRFGIRENDGGIGIDMGPVKDDVDSDTFYRAFFNVQEAEELVTALREAIQRARQKTRGNHSHPGRIKEI